ncbi:auxin-responsive protein IAA20-like [Prosopis cineraria]|uniref:auxin-responsive protein IAA20-like n=1 Tax=Prosopis cineraria TaxID=364024 RepID=UPI002410A91D|nr:auxin-responsive protein IAA20-like [Prosopis cineraria]
MGKTSSSSSSSISSNSKDPAFSTASSLKHLPTDLSLGLSISPIPHLYPCISRGAPSDNRPLVSSSRAAEVNDCSLFVKVYMEGILIGRKLDLLAQDGYHELIKTLEHMFDTTIVLGSEMEEVLQPAERRWHVLTYEDDEGDLIMVGDIPWEMFLSTVKRLRITRIDAFGC